ncbi:hypothetical protein IRJ41_019025 [Triplophysa rosa]|uniref:Chemokine interleukin-8-like domain-containing protein n=1 Tax=Triplophysa rosa TaxID=992332 RepID=A0A9W7T8E8_TRIRA|nr:hypothetical protein IRJ41_019025 [Triplophysa rosa]
MEKQQILIRTLAVIVVIASVIPTMLMTVYFLLAQKLSDCCTNVSRNIVNDSIIGYRLQNQSLPCIKAVIFETNGGSDCVKPRSWAKKTFPKFLKISTTTSLAPPTDRDRASKQ